MNCTEIRQAIDQLPRQAAPQGAVAEHLNDCELCQHHYSDLLLERELADLQVPELSPVFLEKALKRAVEEPAVQQPVSAKRSPWHWPSAMAASVLAAAAGISVLWDSVPTGEPVPVAQVEFAQPEYYRENVRIVIYSEEDRDSAEISIDLAENLELDGYAGKHQLSWTTRLSKGKNLLTLPVLVRDEGGPVQVSSRFGGTRHDVQVQVPGRNNKSTSSGAGFNGRDQIVTDFTG
jgi:hypothetical protein